MAYFVTVFPYGSWKYRIDEKEKKIFLIYNYAYYSIKGNSDGTGCKVIYDFPPDPI
jgi:hypothetical protein